MEFPKINSVDELVKYVDKPVMGVFDDTVTASRIDRVALYRGLHGQRSDGLGAEHMFLFFAERGIIQMLGKANPRFRDGKVVLSGNHYHDFNIQDEDSAIACISEELARRLEGAGISRPW